MEISGQIHVPANLSVGKNTRYPLSRTLVEPQSQSGRLEEDKSLFHLPEFKHQTLQSAA
jgi:hypothetical protein